jgi:hypothetical protein
MDEPKKSSDWFSKVVLVLLVIGATAFLIREAHPPHVPYSWPKNECINNLRLIDGATQEWALERHKSDTEVPTWEDLQPYLTSGTNLVVLRCRMGGTYTLGSVSNTPTCSIPGHVIPPFTNTASASRKP